MSDELAPGTVIGGYRIERRLGSGGMGSVYLAKHPELPRYDALKVLGAGYSGDEAFRKRFLREAELAARREGWEPLPPKFSKGVLGKYVKLVKSASRGATR